MITFWFSGFQIQVLFSCFPDFEREIGLRMALGAQLSDVQSLSSARACGWPQSACSSAWHSPSPAPRLLKSFLYGVSASDPITYSGIAFTLLTIAFLACWIPARRASRVDPMIALRAE